VHLLTCVTTEFKEIRKEWKARKKEEENARKADDERARAQAAADGMIPFFFAPPTYAYRVFSVIN
jgi:hypothetical protein